MTGQQLREQGISDVLAADTAPHRGYADLVREAIDTLIKSGEPFDAEDVRHLVSERYPTAVAHSPNVLPAVFGAMASAKRITAVGMRKPTRRSRHYSRNLVWVGAA